MRYPSLVILVFPAPNRQWGLSRCYTRGAKTVCLLRQAVLSLFQAHEAEFHLTQRADHAFTLKFIVLHQVIAGGTGTDAGTASHPLHILEDDFFTVLQYLQGAWAAVIVAVVFPRSRTFPFFQTLPAESVHLVSPSWTHGALHVQIVAIPSPHKRLAPGTLLDEVRRDRVIDSLACTAHFF